MNVPSLKKQNYSLIYQLIIGLIFFILTLLISVFTVKSGLAYSLENLCLYITSLCGFIPGLFCLAGCFIAQFLSDYPYPFFWLTQISILLIVYFNVRKSGVNVFNFGLMYIELVILICLESAVIYMFVYKIKVFQTMSFINYVIISYTMNGVPLFPSAFLAFLPPHFIDKAIVLFISVVCYSRINIFYQKRFTEKVAVETKKDVEK